jgi:hypothetical protein
MGKASNSVTIFLTNCNSQTSSIPWLGQDKDDSTFSAISHRRRAQRRSKIAVRPGVNASVSRMAALRSRGDNVNIDGSGKLGAR